MDYTLPKGRIAKQARLLAVSPHAPTLASELLSNFPEVMLQIGMVGEIIADSWATSPGIRRSMALDPAGWPLLLFALVLLASLIL